MRMQAKVHAVDGCGQAASEKGDVRHWQIHVCKRVRRKLLATVCWRAGDFELPATKLRVGREEAGGGCDSAVRYGMVWT